ncbi:DUF3659 domain-containing protein [Aspergillus luchuensis]|uniref:LEA domain protein n=1 Tax=Aspergillus kawachii TaxID=1069201 RepID=A0A146EWZ6_ASPKA|nr:uncharacterized protein AKAW2_61358S [Aspergillus luchuensis]BCS03094.1 hypothetical protein AKAW2_61358S [Aspergillus luchuensis]BCS14740.1 hypothetical protein ALUC_61296S [Aspergillus luchuensis]GAA87863.1 LEA domain protein [Aspergillus luchuensis IFO 4308]GAT18537.1 LEA domain protein [Aspergillus luchuensis]
MAATQEDARQVESLRKGDTLKKPSAIRKKAPPKLAKVDKKEKVDKPTLDEKPEKKVETENVGDVGAVKTPEAGLEEQVEKVEDKAGEAGEEAEEELENEDMENEEEVEEELEQQRGPVEQREAMPSDTAAGSSSTARLADKGKGAAVQLGRIGEGTESMKDQVPTEMPDQVQEKAGEGVQEPTEGVVEPEKETDLGKGIPEPSDISELKKAAVSIGDLKGLSVGEGGNIVNAEGKTIGKVVEGDPDDLVGQVVDADGEILDEDGDLIGRVDVVTEKVDELPQADELPKAEELPEAEEVAELPQLPDISTLEGLKCTKFGSILDTQGNLVGELVEGDAKRIFRGGFELDDKGQFWDHRGNVIGKVQPVLPEAEETSIFEGMKDLYVDKEGWVLDDNGQRVGQVVEGDVKKLAGRAVDEDGDILDRHGNLLGHAEPWQEPEEVADEVTEEKPDLSCLAGLKPTKLGLVIGPDQVPLGRVVEGDPKQLAGRTIAPDGLIWGDNGEVIGQVDLIPENERKDLSRPFQGCRDLMVNGSGWVEDGDGNILGRVIEGDPQKLQGYDVDEDGEIVDQHGTVLGRAAPCEPPAEEVEVPDLSALAGKVVNKMGNVVDTNGIVFGRLVTGNPRKLAGKSVDEQGQVWDAAGHVVGQAELIPDAERERPEGPFSGLDGLTVNKEGQVVDPNGTPVGRLVEGDPKRLAGRAVDDDGEVLDSAGNCIGRAEPWSAPEEPPSPMAGRKVNREGEVRDEDGNLIGKLTQGELSNLIGRTIDKDGYVVDSAGNRIGECTLLENIPPEPEPEEPEMSPEEREQLARQEEENELAKKMCSIVQQTLDSLEPMCRMITQHIEKANSTPKDELDEEALVKEVKPLIEEAGTILQECKGALRALDPDGHIAANAKARSASQEATPQEHHLAELLKDLTQLVTETIERGKSMIADMPHAKKEINPLWALLSEPLFQIIAAVGLLLSGVLGLVSNLLNGLGLGGLLQGLLGGLGVDKLLEGLGLGTITQGIGLGGKK